MTIQVNINGHIAFRFAEDEAEHEGEATEASAEEGVVNPVIPVKNEVLWAAVFFFALWALMKFVLLPPLLAARAEREQKIRAARDAGDSVEGDLGSARADYDNKISAAREEANTLMADARADADAYKAELQAAADAEIAEARAAADAELGQARSSAIDAMRGDLDDMAVSAASRVVGTPIEKGSVQATLDRVLGSSAN